MDRLEIAFYGPDGSGKTTLAKMLREYMGRRGYNVYIYWIRGVHTLALIIALILSKFPNMRGRDIPQLGLRVTNRLFWCLIESISIIPIIIKYYLRGRGYEIIISERSFPDVIAWFLTHYRNIGICRLAMKYLLSLTLKRYKVLFYIRADKKTILRRRRFENLPENFLDKQLIIYDKIYESLREIRDRVYLVDTTKKSPTQSLLEILESIREVEGK